MRGVPALPDIVPPPPTLVTTATRDPRIVDSIDPTRAAAYRQRLADACGDPDPTSLDYSHCTEEFSRWESDAQDRDEMLDKDDNEWREGQQAHEDALEQMAR
jgi:hypothetical protein